MLLALRANQTGILLTTATRVCTVAHIALLFSRNHSSFAADDEALKKDMTSVIALQGLPCGQVVVVKVNGENDYACVCKDGNRYHVHMNPAGRVVVEQQK